MSTKDTALEEYVAQVAFLGVQMKELEKKLSEAKAELMEEMKGREIDKIERELGTFSIARCTMYTYSPKVDELAEKVKVAKAKEEQSGVAKPKVTEHLTTRFGA